MKRLFVLLLITLALTACRRRETPAAGTKEPAPPQPAPAAAPSGTAVGSMMPAYSAELLDGTKFDVAGERGNVVLLNLWATWCGPCRYEIPELEALHRKHAGKKFKVVGVSLDEGGRDVVRPFVDAQKISYPIALDPEGRLANLFETSVIPTTVLIDRSGRIVWKHYGAITAGDESLVKALGQALGQS